MIGFTSTAVTRRAPWEMAVRRSIPPPDPMTKTTGCSTSVYWTAIRLSPRADRLASRPSQREINVLEAASISSSRVSGVPKSRTVTREKEFHRSTCTPASARPRE